MSDQFLSAAELAIQDWEREALIWTLKNVLENEKTISIDENTDVVGSHQYLLEIDPAEGTPVFVMANAEEQLSEYRCGSAGCIGGWMKMYKLGLEIGDKIDYYQGRAIHNYVLNYKDDYEGHSPVLHTLFFGVTEQRHSVDLSKVTAQAAGKAARRFLETGDSYWRNEDLED